MKTISFNNLTEDQKEVVLDHIFDYEAVYHSFNKDWKDINDLRNEVDKGFDPDYYMTIYINTEGRIRTLFK